MFILYFTKYIFALGTRMFKNYKKSQEGNFAIYTSILLMVVLLAVGTAIDLGKAQQLKTNMQDIADSALLAASQARPKEQSVMQAVAEAYIEENDLTDAFPEGAVTLSDDKKTLAINLSGTYKTSIMKMFGKASLPVTVNAETLLEVNNYTDIVLVLDATKSMSYNNRMDSLKSSAANFINIIDAADSDKVRMSVVPYARYINVGIPNRNEPWIDAPADYTEFNPDQCSTHTPTTGQTNCRMESYGPTAPQSRVPGRQPTYGTCYDDGQPYQCQTDPGVAETPARPGSPGGTREVCDNTYGPPQTTCTPVAPTQHRWYGCVGSRTGNDNIDPSYSSGESKVPGLLNDQCGQAISPMSTNLNLARNSVNSLVPFDETYSPTGLIWGWRMLDENIPFDASRTRTDGAKLRKVLIFMTDGLNTLSRTGIRHDGTSRNESDDLTDTIRDDMKSDGEIEVFSISFQVNDAQAKNLIRDCATETDQYYEASDAATLQSAFADIGYSLSSPRITR